VSLINVALPSTIHSFDAKSDESSEVRRAAATSPAATFSSRCRDSTPWTFSAAVPVGFDPIAGAFGDQRGRATVHGILNCPSRRVIPNPHGPAS
jgi:hypothetical protein